MDAKTNDGDTPLHRAKAWNKTAVIQLLENYQKAEEEKREELEEKEQSARRTENFYEQVERVEELRRLIHLKEIECPDLFMDDGPVSRLVEREKDSTLEEIEEKLEEVKGEKKDGIPKMP